MKSQGFILKFCFIMKIAQIPLLFLCLSLCQIDAIGRGSHTK